MKREIRKVLDQTMKMPPTDRAAIAEHLIASLEDTAELEVEKAWQQEIQHRLTEIDNSEVECIPWEEVKARLGKA